MIPALLSRDNSAKLFRHSFAPSLHQSSRFCFPLFHSVSCMCLCEMLTECFFRLERQVPVIHRVFPNFSLTQRFCSCWHRVLFYHRTYHFPKADMFLDVFRHRFVRTIHMTILDILCHSHNYILECAIGKDIFDLSIRNSLSS
jgi:hypothetical protein